MMWQMWLFFIQLLNFEKKPNLIVALWVKVNDDNINNWIITISRPNIEKNLDYFYSNQSKNILIILHMVTLNLCMHTGWAKDCQAFAMHAVVFPW